MLRFLVVMLAAALVAGLPSQSEAKRLGGARSVGGQRSVSPPPAPPAQAARAPSQTTQQAAPAAPSAPSRWLPLLGGLAIGGLLGSMFGGAGFGVVALIGLMLIAAVVATRLMRPRPQAAMSAGFASLGGETDAAPPPSQRLDSDAIAAPPAQPPLPAGFDQAGFLRAAKMNFIRLQDVNDRRDIEVLRELTTAAMFELLADEMRRGEAQLTDVVTLDADLLELVSGNELHRASVRFRGLMREQAGAEPVGFEEIWNLEKPVDGTMGWLLAGIQQVH